MLKRAIFAAVVLAILIPVLLDRLKSDDDRIRDLVRAQLEAFGEGSVSGVVDPMAMDFKVKGAAIQNRGEARDVMTAISREARSEVGFNLLLEQRSPEIVVEIEGGRASCHLQLALQRRAKGSWIELWVFDLDLELLRTDDGDWQVKTAAYETLSGRPGF